jgi:hypothetical protein
MPKWRFFQEGTKNAPYPTMSFTLLLCYSLMKIFPDHFLFVLIVSLARIEIIEKK